MRPPSGCGLYPVEQLLLSGLELLEREDASIAEGGRFLHRLVRVGPRNSRRSLRVAGRRWSVLLGHSLTHGVGQWLRIVPQDAGDDRVVPETCTLVSPVSNTDLVWTEEINLSGKSSLAWPIMPWKRNSSRRSASATMPCLSSYVPWAMNRTDSELLSANQTVKWTRRIVANLTGI